MATVYFQATTATIPAVTLWGASYWSGTPANGDTAVFGRGSPTITGGSSPSAVTLAEVRIGHGFTGSIGTSLSMVPITTHGASGAINIQSVGAADMWLVLTDLAASANAETVLDVASGTVFIDEGRTLAAKASTYTHTLNIVARSSFASVIVANVGGGTLPNYTRIVISGAAGSAVTLAGITADEIFSEGCDVIGGSAADRWVVSSGSIQPEDVNNLLVYGGTATLGQVADSDIAYIGLHGGTVDASRPTFGLTLPDSADDCEVFGGTIKMQNPIPLRHHGQALCRLLGGETLSVGNI